MRKEFNMEKIEQAYNDYCCGIICLDEYLCILVCEEGDHDAELDQSTNTGIKE